MGKGGLCGGVVGAGASDMIPTGGDYDMLWYAGDGTARWRGTMVRE